ncbi:MAG TPA: DUF362 domain-containing protein [Armatimonadota bacterium]|nr:DUF362 domain-containing protein [Armatimonadota bacterium]
MATVAIVKCEDYTPSKVFKAVKEAVDLLGGMGQFVSPGQKVLLKPNLLSSRPPDSAVCTHPAVMEAVAGLAAATSGIVCSVGDSPSIGAENWDKYKRLLSVTGMMESIERAGIEPVRFDDSSIEREIPEAKVFHRLLLTKALDECDVLINIPKFKTHGLVRISGAIKNLFGCVPGRRKAMFHLQAGDNPEMFAQMLVDVLRAVQPRLSIMDAIVGMDGQGPAAGRRRNFGLIIASADPVALDATACRVAGIDPMSIPTVRLASEQGLGVADEIEVLGLQPEEVQIEDFLMPPQGDLVSRLPGPIYRLLRNQLIVSPRFVTEKCTDCRQCVEMCPMSVITVENGPSVPSRVTNYGSRLKIDYSRCIRCYCCHEVCPQEAILLRPGRLRRSMSVPLAIRRAILAVLKRETSD